MNPHKLSVQRALDSTLNSSNGMGMQSIIFFAAKLVPRSDQDACFVSRLQDCLSGSSAIARISNGAAAARSRVHELIHTAPSLMDDWTQINA
ncbi:hypothetical protein NHQ30_009727 [Ciborinia camelliae]|nr:hypothetical protein NHQ30_009727 [Ciborinia camelliae]